MTNEGLDASFGTITSVQGVVTDYFDSIFPWIKDDDYSGAKRFKFDVSSWFADSDGDTLTYSIEILDGSPRPSWMAFNK